MAHPEPRTTSGIQVLTQAIDLVLLLGRHPEGLSTWELARFSGLPMDKVRRIARTLRRKGLLQGSEEVAFELGPAWVQIARGARATPLLRTARPLLHHLVASTGESASLVGLVRGMARVMEVSQGLSPLRAAAPVGSPLPLHGTSGGKVLLATLPEEELELLREEGPGLLHPWTGRTLTDWASLELELEVIRETGIAFDHQEYHPGICSIATLLPIPGAPPAALMATIPTQRFREVEAGVVESLKTCREHLSRRWGA